MLNEFLPADDDHQSAFSWISNGEHSDHAARLCQGRCAFALKWLRLHGL